MADISSIYAQVKAEYPDMYPDIKVTKTDETDHFSLVMFGVQVKKSASEEELLECVKDYAIRIRQNAVEVFQESKRQISNCILQFLKSTRIGHNIKHFQRIKDNGKLFIRFIFWDGRDITIDITDDTGEVYIDNDSIRAEETEMCECVVTNKTDHDIWLIFNIDKPISEAPFLHAKESVSIIDTDMIQRIKVGHIQTFYWKEDV